MKARAYFVEDKHQRAEPMKAKEWKEVLGIDGAGEDEEHGNCASRHSVCDRTNTFSFEPSTSSEHETRSFAVLCKCLIETSQKSGLGSVPTYV